MDAVTQSCRQFHQIAGAGEAQSDAHGEAFGTPQELTGDYQVQSLARPRLIEDDLPGRKGDGLCGSGEHFAGRWRAGEQFRKRVRGNSLQSLRFRLRLHHLSLACRQAIGPAAVSRAGPPAGRSPDELNLRCQVILFSADTARFSFRPRSITTGMACNLARFSVSVSRS